jgi:integrase
MYRRRGGKYLVQMRRELGEPDASLGKVVDVFLTSDGRYRSASQRAIKAWLLQVIDDAIIADPKNLELLELPQRLRAGRGPAFVAQLRNKLGNPEAPIEDLVAAFLAADRQYSRSSQEAINGCFRTMIGSLVTGGSMSKTDGQAQLTLLEAVKPKPKVGRRTKNTSAKKRKDVPFDDLQRVTKYLSATGDELNIAAGTYLKLNIFLGLRPGEWKSAYLQGSSFHWTAEKTSNGRGNDKNPSVRLQSPEQWIGTLRWFLDFLKPYRDNEQEWSRLFDRLRSRIAYACEKVGIGRISLYATRDVFIATELLLGTDPTEVAAKVNHKSARTQRRHYATKGSGYKMSHSLTAVDQSLVATVTPIESFSFDKLRGAQPQLPQ